MHEINNVTDLFKIHIFVNPWRVLCIYVVVKQLRGVVPRSRHCTRFPLVVVVIVTFGTNRFAENIPSFETRGLAQNISTPCRKDIVTHIENCTIHSSTTISNYSYMNSEYHDFIKKCAYLLRLGTAHKLAVPEIRSKWVF